MEQGFFDDERYLKAKKKVTDLKGLYMHLIVAVLLIPIFILINYQTDKFTGFIWFWFPVCGIIISLILHLFTVFRTGTDWEERKIKDYMNNEKF